MIYTGKIYTIYGIFRKIFTDLVEGTGRGAKVPEWSSWVSSRVWLDRVQNTPGSLTPRVEPLEDDSKDEVIVSTDALPSPSSMTDFCVNRPSGTVYVRKSAHYPGSSC